MEVKINIKNEKATNAKIPSSEIAGMSIQRLDMVAVANPTILKPGTTRVTIYRAIAEEAH